MPEETILSQIIYQPKTLISHWSLDRQTIKEMGSAIGEKEYSHRTTWKVDVLKEQVEHESWLEEGYNAFKHFVQSTGRLPFPYLAKTPNTFYPPVYPSFSSKRNSVLASIASLRWQVSCPSLQPILLASLAALWKEIQRKDLYCSAGVTVPAVLCLQDILKAKTYIILERLQVLNRMTGGFFLSDGPLSFYSYKSLIHSSERGRSQSTDLFPRTWLIR